MPSSSFDCECRRIDGAMVDVVERHVVVDELVKEDDELDDVGSGHRPEGILPLPEELVDEARERIGESVGVEIVMEWVVAILAIRD